MVPKWLDLDTSKKTILFHRDDPKTNKKCPGAKVTKEWVLGLIGEPVEEGKTETRKPDVGMEWNKWHFCRERWCVPVYDFLLAKGIESEEIVKNLKRVEGEFFMVRNFLKKLTM